MCWQLVYKYMNVRLLFFPPLMGVKFDISLGFVFFKTVVTLDLSTPRSLKLILKDQFPLRCDVLEGDYFLLLFIYAWTRKALFILFASYHYLQWKTELTHYLFLIQ